MSLDCHDFLKQFLPFGKFKMADAAAILSVDPYNLIVLFCRFLFSFL